MASTTVVLVHGAWHNASSWDLLRARLDEKRVTSIALQLPMTTLDEDAAVVRSAIEAVDGDVIVVGHSWGGSPVTMGAAGIGKVKHLIYLAAYMIETGLPAMTFEARRDTGLEGAIVTRGDVMLVDPDRAVDRFYHDVDPELAAQTAAALRPFEMRGLNPVETDIVAAWKTIPTTYVLTLRDYAIHPEDQRLMAKNAQRVIEINTSHSPFLSRPDLVCEIIMDVLTRL